MKIKRQTPRLILSALLLFTLFAVPAAQPASAAEQAPSGLSLTVNTTGQDAGTETIPPGSVPLAPRPGSGETFSPLISAGIAAVVVAAVIAAVILRKARKFE